MTRLWHYTCDHGREGIGEHGPLLPLADLVGPTDLDPWPQWRRPYADIIWLTDLDTPVRDALGLTSRTLGCDRTRHRYRVVSYNAMHYPAVRRDLPRRLREFLEAPGALPMHWWVAYTPVPVTFEPRGVS